MPQETARKAPVKMPKEIPISAIVTAPHLISALIMQQMNLSALSVKKRDSPQLSEMMLLLRAISLSDTVMSWVRVRHFTTI